LTVGDIVFAQVRGFPHWPARITSQKRGKFKVFFYGTYQTSCFLKRKELVPYSQERKLEFSSKYIKQNGYAQGLEEIENNPDIAFGIPNHEEKIERNQNIDFGIPNHEEENEHNQDIAVSISDHEDVKSTYSTGGYSPLVLIKSPERFTTLAQIEKTPTTVASTSTKRKDSSIHSQLVKRVVSEEAVVDKYSRSGRKIKPNSKWDDKEFDVKKSYWYTDKRTGDLVELQLDEDSPSKFESEAQRMEWEMAAARKALTLKKQIESGVKMEDLNIKAKEGNKSIRKVEKCEPNIIFEVNGTKMEHSNVKDKVENNSVIKDEKIIIEECGVKIEDSNIKTKVKDESITKDEKFELNKMIEDSGIKVEDSNVKAKVEDKSIIMDDKLELAKIVKKKRDYLTKRKIMLESLRVEKKLVDLHFSIKDSLHERRPQPKRALELLEELLEIPLNSLALKKHSYIVELIKRLKKYAGPDRMSPQDEMNNFVPLIKKKAAEIYQQIEITFNYVEKDLDEDQQGFHEEFTSQVLEFDEKIKSMEDLEIVELLIDPTTKLS